MHIFKLTTAILFSILSFKSFGCTFGGGQVFISTLTPTPAYNVVSATNNNYFTISVTCGNTYNFDFCANGGDVGGGIWAEITILNAAGNTELGFAPYAGGCTQLTWTATFTGTIQVYITDSGCSTNGFYSGNMAYNETSSGPLSANFSLASVNCSDASATITGTSGGTFTFNPAPGDGATVDASTGAITNGTAGATYNVDYTICGNTQNQSVTLSTGNASFSYAAACGGGNATITGDAGGVFTFDPNPGDGTQLSSTTGTVSNGTVGTTYSVEYTVCGTSTTESVTAIDNNCFALNGNAQYINVGGENCIQLTAAANGQIGCAWNGTQIDFASDFSLSLDYYFGNNTSGADGNTFTFQPSSSSACGQSGAQLGGGGIANSLVVEFDTYDNDGGTNNDLSCDHIAVEIDGDLPDDPSFIPANAPPYCGPVCAKPGGGPINDGGTYAVDIVWNASTQQLEIYFDGNLRLSCSGDFVNTVFGGQSQVYWGATAATGGLNQQQYFCPSSIVVLPVELSSFSSHCSGEYEIFDWTTITENNVDYFQLEYTYDGLIYYPVDQMIAAGNSTVTKDYSMPVRTEDKHQRYYRLKIVDNDGDFEYTEIISSNRCNVTDLNSTVFQKGDVLTIQSMENIDVQLLNQFGQVIYKNIAASKVTEINIQDISSGIYFIISRNSEGLQDSKRVMIH